MKTMKIDRGVPIPSLFDAGPKTPKSELALTLHQMKPGDSFVTRSRDRAKIFSCSYYHRIPVVTRYESEGLIRVWKKNDETKKHDSQKKDSHAD